MSSLPKRYTAIGPLTRPDHKCLEPEDRCFYLGEYTSGAGYGTPTNDLIINFKIPPTHLAKNPKRQQFKDWAVRHIATALSQHFSKLTPGRVIVPIPTSKLPDHPDYDDRLMRCLAAIEAQPPIAVRELIKQRKSTLADHESGGRQSYEDLLENCYLDDALALPIPSGIVLFDDVITDGKHFKVCQELIRKRYGDISVSGFFVARRIYEKRAVDFSELLPE